MTIEYLANDLVWDVLWVLMTDVGLLDLCPESILGVCQAVLKTVETMPGIIPRFGTSLPVTKCIRA